MPNQFQSLPFFVTVMNWHFHCTCGWRPFCILSGPFMWLSWMNTLIQSLSPWYDDLCGWLGVRKLLSISLSHCTGGWRPFCILSGPGMWLCHESVHGVIVFCARSMSAFWVLTLQSTWVWRHECSLTSIFTPVFLHPGHVNSSTFSLYVFASFALDSLSLRVTDVCYSFTVPKIVTSSICFYLHAFDCVPSSSHYI